MSPVWLDALVSDTIRWIGRPVTDDVVTERSFRVDRLLGAVPGVLWLPTGRASSAPLVLLGHGGSGHKRSERLVRLPRSLASQAGVATVAIDDPYHGDRVCPPLDAAEYQARIAADGVDVVIDRMVDDWRAAVDALGALDAVHATRLGYL